MPTLESLSDAVWGKDHSCFTANATFAEFDEPVPYTFSREEHPEIVAGAEAGEYGPVAEYVQPTIPTAPTSVTFKADVWRRATDEEADVIDTELTKLGTRQRRLWDDAQYLDHSDPLVVMLRERMVVAFGAAEADRILAPSA